MFAQWKLDEARHRTIINDNDTSFVGAAREVKESVQAWYLEEVIGQTAQMQQIFVGWVGNQKSLPQKSGSST